MEEIHCEVIEQIDLHSNFLIYQPYLYYVRDCMPVVDYI